MGVVRVIYHRTCKRLFLYSYRVFTYTYSRDLYVYDRVILADSGYYNERVIRRAREIAATAVPVQKKVNGCERN